MAFLVLIAGLLIGFGIGCASVLIYRAVHISRQYHKTYRFRFRDTSDMKGDHEILSKSRTEHSYENFN